MTRGPYKAGFTGTFGVITAIVVIILVLCACSAGCLAMLPSGS